MECPIKAIYDDAPACTEHKCAWWLNTADGCAVIAMAVGAVRGGKFARECSLAMAKEDAERKRREKQARF